MTIIPALGSEQHVPIPRVVLIAREFSLGLLSALLGDRTERSMRNHNLEPGLGRGHQRIPQTPSR